ncbi:MAG: cell division protein ZipA, partial [Pseudomonadota bacterium]|nr:cell division protein ZipA [Pseudomonadota bacterium]
KGNVQGALLLQMMTELGCKFGEMGIFHRYENTNGTGTLIFSVANMFNPGTFDLDNIEQFETDGVALFMTLPINYDGQQAFNMMLNAAKKLATEIPQGQVLDGSRQLLTRQSIQHAHQKVRQYESTP